MKYIQHQTQVRREIEEATASIYADESLLEWTNNAIADIARKTSALVDEQYANSVVGSRAYQLPSYTIDPLIVFYDGVKLYRENISDWWRSSDIAASGTPTRYAATTDTLYLRPIPNTAKQIRYFRTYEPTPIASITATTPMPFADRYNSLIRSYVKARALEQEGDPNEASFYHSRYEAELAEAVWEVKRSQGADTSGSPTEVW